MCICCAAGRVNGQTVAVCAPVWPRIQELDYGNKKSHAQNGRQNNKYGKYDQTLTALPDGLRNGCDDGVLKQRFREWALNSFQSDHELQRFTLIEDLRGRDRRPPKSVGEGGLCQLKIAQCKFRCSGSCKPVSFGRCRIFRSGFPKTESEPDVS